MAVRRNAFKRKAVPQTAEEKKRIEWAQSWLDEALALFCFALGLFLLASFVSHVSGADVSQAVDGLDQKRNIMGPVGHISATLLTGFMGWCMLVPVLCLEWLAVFLWRYDQEDNPTGMGLSWYSPIGFAGVLTFSCTLIAIFWGQEGGGSLGYALSKPLVSLFNTIGATLISVAALTLSLTLTTRLRSIDIAKNFAVSLVWLALALLHIPIIAFRLIMLPLRWIYGKMRSYLRERFFGLPSDEEISRLPKPRRRRNEFPLSAEEQSDEDEEDFVAPPQQNALEKEESEQVDPEDKDDEEDYTHVVVSRRLPQRGMFDKRLDEKKRSVSKREPEESDLTENSTANAFANYQSPDISLLAAGEVNPGGEDDNELLEKSKLIESKLKDFGVLGRVTEVHPGPVVTLFEFEPAPGIKVGRVAALSDDLAMSLKASSIRVIAPIPKRGTVGIEIPNRQRDIVRLRDVLESDAFVNSESILTVCVGKDVYGDPVVVDIASMPHLLIAGATGTGKSVCINAFLLSLLYRASPAELGLIMIDPKILELSVYEGIPHLRVPVVVNPRQAKAVLQWAIDEMHRRYRLIQKYGVRNIDGYNKIVSGEDKKEGDRKKRLEDDVVLLTEDEVLEEGTIDKPDNGYATSENDGPVVAEPLKPLPKILIVIDEVADLMLSVGHDIEELITRLAQKARAAGIHLMIATQRPSVDVVTGLIKANFPARLSFRVTSRVDSRTILDSIGAEKLLGRGDMLFMQPGGDALRRLHGAFVSDNEVKRVVDIVKKQCEPQYDERIMHICEKALQEEDAERQDSASGSTDEEYDPMYDKAVELVVQKGHASTSMIQRVFRLGYNRAARIIERMEKDGVVGPMDGAKPREVLVPRDGMEEA